MLDKKEIDNIDKDKIEEMIRRDTIVKIQFYPNTPVGFYLIYHYDIDKAIDIALDTVKNDTVKFYPSTARLPIRPR